MLGVPVFVTLLDAVIGGVAVIAADSVGKGVDVPNAEPDTLLLELDDDVDETDAVTEPLDETDAEGDILAVLESLTIDDVVANRVAEAEFVTTGVAE